MYSGHLLEDVTLCTLSQYSVHCTVYSTVYIVQCTVQCTLYIVQCTVDTFQVYHQFIHPGPLPLGYRADCMANSAKTHHIPLQLDLANSNYRCILHVQLSSPLALYPSSPLPLPLHPREMVEGMVQFLAKEGSSCLPDLYMLPKYQRQTRLVLDWLQVLATGL